MHTPTKTLLLTLLFVLVLTPGAQAREGCATIATDHEPGEGRFRLSSPGYGRIDIMFPGPGPEGEAGTHYILINYGDIKQCVEELVP